MSEYIEVGQPLQFTDPNTPTRVGEIVENVSDIYNIPSPRLGMQVFVKSEKKSFVITSLKSKVIGGVDVPEAAVEAFKPVGAKSITWNNDNDLSNMNDFVVAGVYDIKGERKRDNDNLPILNTGGGHSFNARLTVLDSSIAPEGKSDDICITQKLTLSNRVAGDGDVYIRTGRGTSKEAIQWETWGKLQQNIEVGQVTTLDDLIDNGIYSGAYVGTGSKFTFVMVVINDYALAAKLGADKVVNQFLYAVEVGGLVRYTTRKKIGGAPWSGEEILNEKEISSMIETEIKKVNDRISTLIDDNDPGTLNSIKDLINWVNEHGNTVEGLLDAINGNSGAIMANFQDIKREEERAVQAENNIKANAMQYNTLGVNVYADRAEIYGRSMNTIPKVVEFPAATTTAAGVMSATDKATLDKAATDIKANANAIAAEKTRAEAAEQTNATAIANETTRAKTAEQLLDKVVKDGISILYTDEKRVFAEMNFTLGFYNVSSKKVGDAFNDALKSSTNKYAASLYVKKGDKVRLSTYVTSATQGSARPWVMVDADNIIVAISVSSYTYDYTDGVEIDVPQDATLYVACNVDYEDAFSLKISGGIVYELRDKVERLVDTSEVLKTTNSPSLYLPNKTVLLSGASISDNVGYFEFAMKKLGLTGTNVSAAGKNISYLCYLLYSNTYRNHDVLIISHIHNFDVYSLPASVENYSAAEYEADEVLAPYVTTRDYREGTIVPPDGYTVDEIYAICYDYAIKKWMERCYNLRTTEGYDSLAGKNCQIVLMTYWHDARTVYNSAIRKLAKKWGLPLIKEDENIGFSKNRVHPVTGKQWSVLYCNGVPYSSKTEVINGVTYGFHPSGIATENWDTFANADAETMLQMLPDIQRRRAAIMIDFFKNAIYE